MVAGANRASGLQEPGEDGDAKTDMDDTDACLRFRVRIARFVEGNPIGSRSTLTTPQQLGEARRCVGTRLYQTRCWRQIRSLPPFRLQQPLCRGWQRGKRGTGSFGFPDMPLDDYDPLLEDDMELDGGSWHDSDSAEDTDNADNDKALTRFVEYVPLTFTIVPIKHRTDVFYIVANLLSSSSRVLRLPCLTGVVAIRRRRKQESDLRLVIASPLSLRARMSARCFRRGGSAGAGGRQRMIFANFSQCQRHLPVGWLTTVPGRAREMSGGSVGLDKSEMSILEMLSGVAGSWCTRTLTDYAYRFLQFHVMIEENSHGMPVVQCHCRVKVPRMFGGFASQWRKYLELSLDGQVNNLQNLRSIAMSPTLCTNFSLPTEPRGMIMGGEGDRCHRSRMISKDMALVATAGREDGTRCGRVLQEKMAWGRTGLGSRASPRER